MQSKKVEQKADDRVDLCEANSTELMTIEGGRPKLQEPGRRPPLLTPDGDPVTVIVDGHRVGNDW